MDELLLSSHYSVMLMFLCPNHMLQETADVLMLKTPVVFHCMLTGHTAFLSIVQFFSLQPCRCFKELEIREGVLRLLPALLTWNPHLRSGLSLLFLSRTVSDRTVMESTGMPTSGCTLLAK